ncbi:MAG: MFS transporter [Stenotrophomonas sp.]|jgi:PAT family beta-lactamase induction signal transducer AmpG|nr:MAG: MFS transporter [Stenotrophomonas sp.]
MKPRMGHWPTQLLIGWLNFALVAPSIFLYLGLPMIMRQHGWSGTDIGVFQLAGLPAIAKFLLAAPIERGEPRYRRWSLLLGAAYVASLLLLATQDVATTSRITLFTLVFTASLMATWVDIPLNALAIQSLPAEERLRAGAIRSAATSLGAIVGGGAMLLLYARQGWGSAFLALAALLGVGLLLLPLLCTQNTAPAEPAQSRGRWRSYFSEPARRRWTVLVLLYFPCIGAAWIYLKPLLLDLGMAPERIALLVGVGGGTVAAAASLFGARIAKKYGSDRALVNFAIINLGALLLLWAVTALHLGMLSTIVAIIAVAAAMGMSSGLVFGLMMSFTRSGLAAMDYGIQSSLFACSRILVPLMAGVLLDHGGQAGMFAGLTIGLVIALLLAMRYAPVVSRPR